METIENLTLTHRHDSTHSRSMLCCFRCLQLLMCHLSSLTSTNLSPWLLQLQGRLHLDRQLMK